MWLYCTFLTCDLIAIVMACCLEAGTQFCVPTGNRRYILLFWEQLLSPPGKCWAELANTGHDFSPPNIKWTDSKVWVGSSLYSVSQRYTMIWPDQTILFVDDCGHVTVCYSWPTVMKFHKNTTPLEDTTTPLEDTPAPYVWFLESVIRTATRWRVLKFFGGRSDNSFRINTSGWNTSSSNPLMTHGRRSWEKYAKSVSKVQLLFWCKLTAWMLFKNIIYCLVWWW